MLGIRPSVRMGRRELSGFQSTVEAIQAFQVFASAPAETKTPQTGDQPIFFCYIEYKCLPRRGLLPFMALGLPRVCLA